MLNLAGTLYFHKHCFIAYIDILIGCYVTVKRNPIGRLQEVSQKLRSLEKVVKVNINEVWHEGHIATVSFYILTFILGFTSNHTPKIERNVSVKYENKILSRPRPVFSTSSSVHHPSSRYDIMHQTKFRTLSCKNARMWTITKFVLKILQHALIFFSVKLYIIGVLALEYISHAQFQLAARLWQNTRCLSPKCNKLKPYVRNIFSEHFLNISVNFICTYACGEGYPGNKHSSQRIFRLWQCRTCKREKHCFKAVNNNVSQSKSKWERRNKVENVWLVQRL